MVSLRLILFHKTVIDRGCEDNPIRSKPDDEGLDRFAAADAPELAVKVLRGFLGIAFIV